jgi:hypothetical protein
VRLLAGTERADALGVMHPGSQTPPNMTLLEGHDRAAAIDPITKLAQLRALLVADHEKATAARDPVYIANQSPTVTTAQNAVDAARKGPPADLAVAKSNLSDALLNDGLRLPHNPDNPAPVPPSVGPDFQAIIDYVHAHVAWVVGEMAQRFRVGGATAAADSLAPKVAPKKV